MPVKNICDNRAQKYSLAINVKTFTFRKAMKTSN